ncbi:MAG TPA: ElyC/SanA/YdcF family protein [Candidatus Angelobacter sp.]|jgi:SanA protein|nr:ElyC/SanA/YdcF family protein [Candidatus Angelobacter sp.]
MSLPKKQRLARKIILALLVIAVCFIGAIASALALVRHASKGRLYTNVSEIPHRPAGLVLGCSRLLGNGTPNPFFNSRLHAAIELFQAGKVDYLLVSGDNHTKGYDEATDFKEALLQAGIPTNRVYCDCAGFRTLDSIVRARDVFGLKQITVVSQEFHNQRAIFLSNHEGIDAIGYNAQDVDLGDASGAHKREKLAKVKAVLDIYLLRTKPHFLGPKISMGVDEPTTCSSAQ